MDWTAGSMPALNTRLVSFNNAQGKDLSLDCSVQAHPKASIRWLKDGAQIQASDSIEVSYCFTLARFGSCVTLGNTSRMYIKRLLHLRKLSSYTFLCLLVPLLWFIFQHMVNSNIPLCVLCTTKRSRLNYVATSVGQNQISELLILV